MGTEAPTRARDGRDANPGALYSMYGLTIRSDFGLSGWFPGDGGKPDVEIRSAKLDGPDARGAPHGSRWAAIDGAIALGVEGVGRYRASRGRLIEVDPEPAAKAEDLDLYISGAMMGAILHQRGLFPLHASSVVLGERAVAFSGVSGAGKSTLVAALVERGATLVTDDSCVLDLSQGRADVWPGPRRMKLDDHSLTLLNQPSTSLTPAGSNTGKFQVPVGEAGQRSKPVPLGTVYLLTEGASGPRAEPMTTMDALTALVDQAHFLAFARELDLGQQVFRLAATAASRIEVCQLVRRRGLEFLPATIDLIESRAQRS